MWTCVIVKITLLTSKIILASKLQCMYIELLILYIVHCIYVKSFYQIQSFFVCLLLTIECMNVSTADLLIQYKMGYN